MLKRKILIFEIIFGLYFLLQTLRPHEFTPFSSFIGFVLLSFNKYHFEGFRISYLIFAFIQVALLIFKSKYLCLPVIILVVFAILYFPIFEYPTPTGKYRVGYKMIHIDGPCGGTSVGIYYPTDQTTQDVKYSPTHKAWERFADIVRLYASYNKSMLIPKFLFKLALSFLEHQYLGVNKDAQIVKAAGSKGFPLAVFSHGLSANIHLYSVILKEWASHGIIVFSVDHDEEIHVNVSKFRVFNDYLKERNAQLGVRKATVKKILDLVLDPKYIHNLFDDQTIAINHDKVFASGHSFGGATAAEVAVEDKRITGGVVLLDPWVECCDGKVLYKRTDNLLLSIRSDTFDKSQIKKMIINHITNSNPHQESRISGLFENSGHNSSTDLQILMPREMSLSVGRTTLDEREAHLIGYSVLTRVFLKTVEEIDKESIQQGKESLRKIVMERYRNQLKEVKHKDVFTED